MPLHIIIDGYNLIRQSPILSNYEDISLEFGRSELIKILQMYKKEKGHAITVVFDAWGRKDGAEERTRESGIMVLYSSPGQTADDVIVRMSKTEGDRAVVVTSDRLLIEKVEKNYSHVIPSDTFEIKLMLASPSYKQAPDDEDGDNISKRLITKKKGPAFKLSKKRRRRQLRLKKL